MLKINQVMESVRFHVDHHEQIIHTRATVLEAAKQFLANPGLSSLLPANIRTDVEQAIQDEQPAAISSLIRPLAAAYVKARLSGPFWALVDACYFLDDATGAGWPYMTQDRRCSALYFAGVEAKSIEAELGRKVCSECGAVEHGNLFCNTCRQHMNATIGCELPPWPHKAETPCGPEDMQRFIDKLNRLSSNLQ